MVAVRGSVPRHAPTLFDLGLDCLMVEHNREQFLVVLLF